MKILLTGASGFVGRGIFHGAVKGGHSVRAIVRSSFQAAEFVNSAESPCVVRNLDGRVDIREALRGIDLVIHTAAQPQSRKKLTRNEALAIREVNVDSTLNIARQSLQEGVRRFIFISSVKVNGEVTSAGEKFSADSASMPQDAYAISKLDAEEGLRSLASQSAMDIVILRPPLVYGVGVKGNFSRLVSWIRQGYPFPFGAVNDNLRSLVGLDNLVDLVLLCAHHPKASNQTFLVSDGEDVSTAELLRRIGVAVGRQARLLPVPEGILRFAAKSLGKEDEGRRLLDSLQIDITKTRSLLGWIPPLSLDEGLRRSVGR